MCSDLRATWRRVLRVTLRRCAAGAAVPAGACSGCFSSDVSTVAVMNVHRCILTATLVSSPHLLHPAVPGTASPKPDGSACLRRMFVTVFNCSSQPNLYPLYIRQCVYLLCSPCLLPPAVPGHREPQARRAAPARGALCAVQPNRPLRAPPGVALAGQVRLARCSGYAMCINVLYGLTLLVGLRCAALPDVAGRHLVWRLPGRCDKKNRLSQHSPARELPA